MLVTKELTVAIDFHSIFCHATVYKSMATINCLVTHILKYLSFFFWVQQKENTDDDII